MHRVYMMQASASEDILPPRCVMTGIDTEITFRPCAVPIVGGGAVNLQLPFNELAYKRWTAVRLLLTFAVFVAVLYALGAMLLAIINGPLGAVLFLGGCALPLWTYGSLVRRTGPRVEKLRANAMVLLIPSASTAQEFQPRIDEAECMVLTIQERQKAHGQPGTDAPPATLPAARPNTLRELTEAQRTAAQPTPTTEAPKPPASPAPTPEPPSPDNKS